MSGVRQLQYVATAFVYSHARMCENVDERHAGRRADRNDAERRVERHRGHFFRLRIAAPWNLTDDFWLKTNEAHCRTRQKLARAYST